VRNALYEIKIIDILSYDETMNITSSFVAKLVSVYKIRKYILGQVEHDKNLV